MTDEKIIALIQEGRHDRAFLKLYKGYPQVEKLICSKGGQKEDAQDVFQEALIILCRKIKNGEFVLKAQLSTYLYSVCSFIWSDELKKRKKWQATEHGELKSDENDEAIQREQKFTLAEKALEKLGEKCRDILSLFYFKSFSMQKIAEKLGYKTTSSVKTQKYKCLERAKKHLSALQNTTKL